MLVRNTDIELTLMIDERIVATPCSCRTVALGDGARIVPWYPVGGAMIISCEHACDLVRAQVRWVAIWRR